MSVNNSSEEGKNVQEVWFLGFEGACVSHALRRSLYCITKEKSDPLPPPISKRKMFLLFSYYHWSKGKRKGWKCMCVANQYSGQILKENGRMRDDRRDIGHRWTVNDKTEERESRWVREKTRRGDTESRKESTWPFLGIGELGGYLRCTSWRGRQWAPQWPC